MVSQDKDNLDLKITDFGFASLYPKDEGGFDRAMGTPVYMAPEIISQQKYN